MNVFSEREEVYVLQCVHTCSYHNCSHTSIAIETGLYDLCSSKEGVSLVFIWLVGGMVQWEGCLGHRYTLTCGKGVYSMCVQYVCECRWCNNGREKGGMVHRWGWAIINIIMS